MQPQPESQSSSDNPRNLLLTTTTMFHQDSSQHSTASTDTMSTLRSLPGRISALTFADTSKSGKRRHTFADSLAKEQQHVLSEEIRRCKSHVKNLEQSYRIRSQFKQQCKNPRCLLAKEYAVDLAEEIETCKYELCAHHHDVCINACSKPYTSLTSLFRSNGRRGSLKDDNNSKCSSHSNKNNKKACSIQPSPTGLKSRQC